MSQEPIHAPRARGRRGVWLATVAIAGAAGAAVWLAGARHRGPAASGEAAPVARDPAGLLERPRVEHSPSPKAPKRDESAAPAKTAEHRLTTVAAARGNALDSARQFASAEEELAFLTERARGERFTLESQQAALDRLARVLDGPTRPGENTAKHLEERRARLQEKLETQTLRVADIDRRISELSEE